MTEAEQGEIFGGLELGWWRWRGMGRCETVFAIELVGLVERLNEGTEGKEKYYQR